ncbi:ABC transporter permease [Castellaniella hirudinis]|uniref:ABC transporter permease n=1 Tax=Castellaniella hirudinis TaxID=1144617 RepID=UPI0039C2DC43
MNPTLPPFSPGAFLTPAVDWLNTHWHPLFALISDVIQFVLDNATALLLAPPPWGLMLVVVGLAFVGLGRRPAMVALLALGFCWGVGLWDEAMQTITLVSVAVALSVAIAFPLGVLAARRPRLEAAIRPVLDIMQTVPPWVYLIPAVILFSLGNVPAIIATIVYGIPPMLRLTTLAFQQIPKDLLELGQALGAPPRTVLFKIEVPAAMPTLLVGLNQCILLSLAMVVLAGLVGSGGLGAEVTRGLTRMEMGLGLRAGLAIVAVALLLDRLSRAALGGQGGRVRR